MSIVEPENQYELVRKMRLQIQAPKALALTKRTFLNPLHASTVGTKPANLAETYQEAAHLRAREFSKNFLDLGQPEIARYWARVAAELAPCEEKQSDGATVEPQMGIQGEGPPTLPVGSRS